MEAEYLIKVIFLIGLGAIIGKIIGMLTILYINYRDDKKNGYR